MAVSKMKAEKLLSRAGITINGDKPWDIQVRNEKLYNRALTQGSLGLGEAYMDGWWDCIALDEFFTRIFKAGLNRKIVPFIELIDRMRAKLYNLQAKAGSYEVAHRHYNLSPELFENMLDRRQIYSCGFWENASNLDEAQEAKLDLIAKKLYLEPGMKVLDIGCGWGGAARFFSEEYGVEVVGITISAEQVRIGKQVCKGLPVDIRLQNYQDLDEEFDRIFSIGMFEHVGYKNFATYMKTVRRSLKKSGLFLLHCIGTNISQISTDPWIQRYIFPNSSLPSAQQISNAAEGMLIMEDWQNFGADYDKTLMSWFSNFKKNWNKLEEDFDARFFRMWKFYLLACAGNFRARNAQLWQIVFSPTGVPQGYKAPQRIAAVAN